MKHTLCLILLFFVSIGIAASQEDNPSPYPGNSPFPPGKEPSLTHTINIYWNTLEGMETKITVKASGHRPSQMELHKFVGSTQKGIDGSIYPNSDYSILLSSSKDKKDAYFIEGQGTLILRIYGFNKNNFTNTPIIKVEYLRDGKSVGETSLTSHPVPHKFLQSK